MSLLFLCCFFATPLCQAPLSMGFLQSRILDWVCHALLQGIFPIQGLNPGLPHCRRILYHLSHQGSPSESVYIYPLRLQPSSHPSIPPFYVITEGPWFLVALGFGFCPTRGSGVDGKQSQFWPPVKQLITLDL